MNNNKLLCLEQYSFRPGHSTELAALQLVNKITGQMDIGKILLSIHMDVFRTRFHRMELHGRQCPYKSFRDGLSNTISVLYILIPLYSDNNYKSDFLKIKYNSQELILRIFIIYLYLILFTTFYKCISVILFTKLCMIIQSIILALHNVLYMYLQHVCYIIYECYLISHAVSSLFIGVCNIIYWRPLSKRIMIVVSEPNPLSY